MEVKQVVAGLDVLLKALHTLTELLPVTNGVCEVETIKKSLREDHSTEICLGNADFPCSPGRLIVVCMLFLEVVRTYVWECNNIYLCVHTATNAAGRAFHIGARAKLAVDTVQMP